MPEDIRYQLYDTAIFSTALAGEQQLFGVAQGADATHTKAFTNSRGAGSLPQGEKFVIDRIGVYLDENNLLPADLVNVWRQSYLEIRVQDLTYWLSPLRPLAYQNAWGGHYSQTAAANGAAIGLLGEGYELDVPIVVPGGSSFKVIVNQGTVLATATQQLKVTLDGILSR